jgi:formylglycine-generating enzyme required for sulfatase activity
MAVKQIDDHFFDDLFAFIETLRQVGYPIGTDQFIHIQELLLRLSADNKLPEQIDQFSSFIGPMICKTPDQLEDFNYRFKTWCCLGQTPKKKSDKNSEKKNKQTPNFLLRYFFLCVVLCVIAGIFVLIGPFSTKNLLKGNIGVKDIPTKVLPASKIEERNGKQNIHTTIAGKASNDNSITNSKQSDQSIETEIALNEPGTEVSYVNPITHSKQGGANETGSTFRNQGTVPSNVDQITRSLQANYIDNYPEATEFYTPPIFHSLLQKICQSIQTWMICLINLRYSVIGFFLGATLLLLIGCMIRWWRFNHATLYLKHQYSNSDVDISAFFVKEPEPHLFKSIHFFRIAQKLRKHTKVLSNRLDTQKTVRKTVSKSGLFSPVMAYSVTLPEYLILIDRVTHHDHQADFVHALIARLLDNGVMVTMYYFDGDPQVCYGGKDQFKTYVTLSQLNDMYPNHSLIIFSNGTGFVNTITGELAGWVNLFQRWTNRAILMPDTSYVNQYVKPFSRGNFMVLPADEKGMSILADQWQIVLNDIPSHMLAPVSSLPDLCRMNPLKMLSDEEIEKNEIIALRSQLKSYLGSKGYDWLCACAVYPELIWQLTLYLGYQLNGTDKKQLYDFDLLRQLIRLPWFRHGNMPSWLRNDLIKDMPRKKEKAVRQALYQLFLTANEKPVNTFAIDYAVISKRNSRQLGRHFFKQIKPKDMEDPLFNDHIFVTFMRNDLSVKIPKIISLLKPDYDRPILSQWRWLIVMISLITCIIWFFPSNTTSRKTLTEPITNMPFIWIPGGCFMIGQTDQEKQYLIRKVGEEVYQKEFGDESSGKYVCVKGFWMGKYEVTVNEYMQYVKEMNNDKEITKKNLNISCNGQLKERTLVDKHPVSCVSVDQARAFIDWLNSKNKKDEFIFRLPHEVEWEYAARAGSKTMWYWGDESNEACQYANIADQSMKEALGIPDYQFHECNDRYASIAPVGQLLPNAFGLYDMTGNLWEWCEDSYNGYSSIRGGGFTSEPVYIRNSMRDRNQSSARSLDVGFRVVIHVR